MRLKIVSTRHDESGEDGFVLAAWVKVTFVAFIVFFIASINIFTYFYAKYARIIDHRLRSGVFTSSSVIYAAPQPVAIGDPASVAEIASALRRAGYSESKDNGIGWYQEVPNAIEVHPGPDAYEREQAAIKIENGRVAQIVSMPDKKE